jgi:4-amino-4-deoxy-L-arabinose transferase-like glycosyltransferase
VHLRWLALALITALAAALRLVDLGAVRLDPFYDAAVRSMGLSWHNFFFGAYEPGGSVSVDKPPVDLWLQVASVKLLGWGSVSLKLPEALAGTASVPLLYAAVRRPFGALAGLVAALALATLPIEVVTARSDTMDAVMMMLLVVALLALVLACESGRTMWLLAAAAALGLAFNVKLLESIVALPGLFVLACLGLPRRPHASSARGYGRPAGQLAAAACVYVLVALSWLGATLLYPASERPYAIGSTNGSAWNAAFVFNGTERLSGKTMEVGQSPAPLARHTDDTSRPTIAGTPPQASTVAGRSGTTSRPTATGTTPPSPSPTRLLARNGELPAKWLGWEALAALVLGMVVVVSVLRAHHEDAATDPAADDMRRVRSATAIGLFVWLLTGIVLFSAMMRLHPRYVESFVPAVAAMYGIGTALVAGTLAEGTRRTHGTIRLRQALAVALTALLAIPLVASIQAARADTSDAGNVGALRGEEQRLLSSYLLAHQGGARYELAAGEATNVASLIVQDGRPVLMLTTYDGLPFTSVAKLKLLIEQGQVRYAFLDSVCGPRPSKTVAGCAPAALWVRAHGTDVSLKAGLHAHGILWRLPRMSA